MGLGPEYNYRDPAWDAGYAYGPTPSGDIGYGPTPALQEQFRAAAMAAASPVEAQRFLDAIKGFVVPQTLPDGRPYTPTLRAYDAAVATARSNALPLLLLGVAAVAVALLRRRAK